MYDYKKRIQDIQYRLNPENVLLEKAFSNELLGVSYSDILTYLKYAMKGVEPAYTQKSMDAGERVKQHLSRELSNVAFRYQGSVMTNTHIKGHSDIDLLTISDKFYNIDLYRINNTLNEYSQRSLYSQPSIDKLVKERDLPSYTGNSIQDLRKNRMDSERILSAQYINCDITKPKSIKIKNLNLNREVDVVIANWYDDIASVINNKGIYRGIQIYNKETDSRENPDYPFLSIDRINNRSAMTNGRLKRMIRFLKNIKADSEQNIEMSSFEINAICYNIPTSNYDTSSYIGLVVVLYDEFNRIYADKAYADSIVSVDGREYIFRNNTKRLENLRKMLTEINGIIVELRDKKLI